MSKNIDFKYDTSVYLHPTAPSKSLEITVAICQEIHDIAILHNQIQGVILSLYNYTLQTVLKRNTIVCKWL